MSYQDQLEQVIAEVLKLIDEGKEDEAVDLITRGQTLETQVLLLKKLNGEIIKLIKVAKNESPNRTSWHVLIRALALALARDLAIALGYLDRDRARDLDRDLDRALDHAITLDRDLDHAITLDRARDLALALDRALDLAHALALALDLIFPENKSARDRVFDLSSPGNERARAFDPETDTSTTHELASMVSFSTFYPRKIETDTRAVLFVYTHLETAVELIEKDIMKFREELGGEIPAPKTAKDKVRLKPGTMVTIVPECDELEFNPPTLTKRWEPDWVRYEFDFKAGKELVGETAISRFQFKSRESRSLVSKSARLR